jgi:hypothetical protein
VTRRDDKGNSVAFKQHRKVTAVLDDGGNDGDTSYETDSSFETSSSEGSSSGDSSSGSD